MLTVMSKVSTSMLKLVSLQGKPIKENINLEHLLVVIMSCHIYTLT